MNILDQVNYRMRSRQWEDDARERRACEFRAALDKLEQEEYRASFPDNPTRIRDLERIRAQKRELLTMQDEEFGLSEQYSKIADS